MAVRGNYKEIKKLVKTALEADLSVLVLGHPGVGKSTMAKELAEEFGLPLIEIRLAHVDPAELVGVQMPDRESGKLIQYVPEWVPSEKPAFIFLDEINAGVTKLHQAAAYQIVLDKRAGKVKFASGTKVMAAGNLEEDNAIVTPLSQALNNRFVHFILEPDVDAWLEWARKAGITDVMRAYVSFRGIKGLYNNTGQQAFPTPRSIAMADNLYKRGKEKGMKKSDIKKLIASCIGEGDAVQFMAFEEIYSSIDIEQVIKTGQGFESKEQSFLYALTYSAASYVRDKMDKNAIAKYHQGIIKFLNNLSSFGSDEFVVLFLREVADKREKFNQLVNFLYKDKHFMKIVESVIDAISEFS